MPYSPRTEESVPGTRSHPPGLTRRAAAGCLLLALFCLACHDVTEYSEQGEYAVFKVDLSELSIESSLGGFQAPRSICSLGNTEFVVASTEGLLYRVSSNDMTVEGVYSVGAPFTSGYGSMVRSSAVSLYLVAGFGNVVEFNLTTNAVADEFSAGPDPVGLSRASDGGSILVIDGQDAGIREFDTQDNSMIRQAALPSVASAIVPWVTSPGELQIAISAVEPAAYPVWMSYLLPSTIDLPSLPTDIAAFQDTTIFCTVQGGPGPATATIYAGYPMIERTETIPLSGQPMYVCSEQVSHSFYVASLIDDANTRIYEIDGFDCTITRTLDVPGYPWDLAAHANGEYLLILTST